MELSEVARKYESAKMRFLREITFIEEEYVLSKYKFKKGDIVRFKNMNYEPTLCVVDDICFLHEQRLLEYRQIIDVRVYIHGHIVDEDGYIRPFIVGGSHPRGVKFEAKDVYEITKISYKNKIR